MINSNSLTMDMNDLKKEIINIAQEHPVFLYIGVGAASAVGADAQIKLPLEQYQQFPPFLQDMRNRFPNLHLFLLLIDPCQETPPKVAQDYELYENNSDHYSSNDKRLQAFVYRQSVYTDPDFHASHNAPPNAPPNALNLTTTLRDLNRFAIENRVSLLYHDFTGRRVARLAECFDIENAMYLDQIVYGMSAREDHGCYFDLTLPNAYFPVKLDALHERPIVKMFNYYHYIVNENLAESERDLLEEYPAEMRELAIVQKIQIVNNIRIQFKVTYLSLLRQIRKIILGQDHIAPAEPIAPADHIAPAESNYIFNDLPKFYRDMFIDLYTEKEYMLIYELLFNYSASELDTLSQLKGMDMSGEDILTFITLDDDPYKWYNAIGELI